MWTLALALMLQAPPLPAATQLDSLAWDYSDAQMQNGGATGFRVTFDTDAPISVPLTARVAGTDTYRLLLPRLAVGEHTASIVACGAAPECSAPATLKFTFSVKPSAVTNPRLDKSGGS